MVIGCNDTYRIMMTTMMMMMIILMMMMMIRMMKTQNGQTSANFVGTTSRFCKVIDHNDSYRMMIMMKTKITKISMTPAI